MTELDKAIAAAFASQGKQEDVNKAYLTLLNTPLFMPVKKTEEIEDAQPAQEFSPLFAKIDENYFLLVFDSLERLQTWAGEQIDHIGYVELTGKDVAAGISDEVYLCLNYGTEYYKEFSPDEVKYLKKIVGKIDQIKND